MNRSENPNSQVDWLCRFVLLFAVAIVFCVTSGCSKEMIENFGSQVVEKGSQDDVREIFRRTAEQCPVKMDEYTTLSSVTVLDDRNVEFRYEVTREGRELVKRVPKERLRKSAIAAMKRNKMAVAVAEKDLSVQHIYEDKFGSYVLSFTINKQVLAGNLYPSGSERSNPFLDGATPVKASGKTNVVIPANDPAELPQQFKVPKAGRKENPGGVSGNPFLDA